MPRFFEYIKKSIEKNREGRKLADKYTAVRTKCLKAREEYEKIILLIDEAIIKAPDARVSSKLSSMRARTEICINRIEQMLIAISDRDNKRLFAIDEALSNMRVLVNKDASDILKEYVQPS